MTIYKEKKKYSLYTYLQAFKRSSGDMSSKPLALFTLHHTSANDMIPPQSYYKEKI